MSQILGSGQCANCSRLQADVEKLTTDLHIERGCGKQLICERDTAHRQIETQQQTIDSLQQRLREQCNDALRMGRVIQTESDN